MLTKDESEFYPISLLKLKIKPLNESKNLITLSLGNDFLEIAGDRKAFENFAKTLINLSNSSSGIHFHIDFYEGNNIVDITNISLTLSLKSE